MPSATSAQARRRRCATSSPPSSTARSITSAPPRSCGSATSVRSCARVRAAARPRAAPARRSRGARAPRSTRACAVGRSTPMPSQQAAEEAGVAEADARARQARRVERRAQHLEHLDRAAGRVGADQLDPGLEELALLPALRAHRAVGVREVAEAQRRLGVRDSGSRPGARSGSSCRSAARAPGRARRTAGSWRPAARSSPCTSTSSYSIVGVQTSP